MKIQTRVYLFLAAMLAFMISSALLELYSAKSSANADNRARIEQIMRSTYLTIVQLENLAAEGVLSDEQAKAIATRITRENKYHPSEYCYVTDENLNFVATPLDPQLHGTSFNDFKDDQGQSVGAKAVASLKASGGKLTDYWWSTIREGKKVDVLSVAIQTPRWKWIVGNGVSFAEADARFWDGVRVQLVFALSGMIVIGGIALIATRSLVRALGGEPDVVISRLTSVSKGDLSGDDLAPNAKPIAERSVLGATEKMRESLRGLVIQLTDSTHAIQRICHDISTGSGDLSHRTVETISRLEKTNDSLSDLSQAIKANVVMSQQAQELANTASTVAGRGGESMAVVVSTMQQINASSSKINDIIGVIDGIAFQTNLLALNAAVEAARAGENGRGFAVVAAEVRNLAQRSSNAAREIKELISDTTSRINSGSELVNTAGLTMQEIVKTGKGVGHTVSEINAIALGQSSNTETLSAEMHELKHMTSQNGALVEITNNATAEMLKHVEKLTSAVHAFKL